MSLNKFNKKLWELGKETEDTLKPEIDEFFGCDFYRNDDVFDVLDFHDDNKFEEIAEKWAIKEYGRKWKNKF